MDEIHPLVTFSSYRGVNGLLPRRGAFAALLQESVTFSLGADGRGGPMAGQDRHVVAERQQLRLDAGDEFIVAAIRKVGAADGALKQRVADQRKTCRRIHKHQMSGRVTGDM